MSISSGLDYVLEGPAGAPCVTFVPGIGNDRDFWAHQAARLTSAQTHRTLRFDPWGCGRSAPVTGRLTITAIAEGITALWNELEIRRSAVVGLGFGGSAALHLGALYPDRVSKVVAFCCRPRQPESRRDFWRARAERARQTGMRDLAEATVERWLGAYGHEHPEAREALVRGFLRYSVEAYCAYLEAFIDMDITSTLSNLTTPTHLVAAGRDHGGGPVPAMRALSRALDAPLSVIADSGHIVAVEAPDEVSDVLRSVLT